MKHFTLLLAFIATALFANAQTNILYEDFATLTKGGYAATSGTTGPDGTEITTNLTANFPTSYKAYSAGGAVKLGTSSLNGSITSAPLDLSVNGGAFKVKIKVKGWSTVEGSLLVTVGTLTPQTLTYTATVANLFEEVEASFTGGTANTTITIATSAKRAFIDEVTVYYGGSTLSNDATLSDLQVNGTTVTGFTSAITNYFVTLPSTTTAIPTVTATTTNTNAVKAIVPATSYTMGTAYVNVTAENTTTTKQYTLYFSKDAAEGEKGSKSNPYTVAEAKAILYPTGTTTKYWVEGYIIGSVGTGTPFTVNATDVDTNLALADASTETDVNSMIPVELPAGTVRTALGVLTTPTNKGLKAKVYGSLVSYYTVTGVKSTSDYVLNGVSGINTPSVNSIKVYSEAGKMYVNGADAGAMIQIYSTTGSLVKRVVSQGSDVIDVPKGLYIIRIGADSAKILVK